MKKLYFIILFFMFLNVYNQEEFFGYDNGLSVLYLQGYNQDHRPVYAAGISAYTKIGIAGSFSLQHVNYETYPSGSIVFYISPEEYYNPIKFVVGLTYTNMDYGKDRYQTLGISAGLIQCFFPRSNFTFSLNGSFSHQMGFIEINDIAGDPFNVVGLGYTQTFFRKNTLYPFFGISYAFEVSSDNKLYSAVVGLNCRLDFKSGKRERSPENKE